MHTNAHKPIIGITTGDLNGVGLELIIKVFSDNRMLDLCTPVIFASTKVVNFYRKAVSTHDFSFTSTKDLTKLNKKQVNVFTCWDEEVPITPGELTDIAGKYAIRSLMVASQCLKDGEIEGIVTAPIHKSNTQTPDFNYTGHTPFFKEKFEAKDVLMLLYDKSIKVALATEHIPIAKIAESITKELLTNKLNLLSESLTRDFGIDTPKIAVLGLNPHAGDEGKIGNEEQETIIPVIESLKQKGKMVFGPFSADAFFAHGSYNEFDATLAMYHDQGLVALKTIAHDGGVNYTAGMNVVRTSPDHGTALDIAGKNIANESSMREAVFQCIDLIKQRKEYDSNTADPLKRGSYNKDRQNSNR